MKINIDINENYGEEMEVNIRSRYWSEALDQVVQNLEGVDVKRIAGVHGDQTMLLSPESIDFIYAENRKIYASVKGRSIQVNMKLYQLEQLLAPVHFTRFSKSVIGNLRRISKFELSFNGNLCVYFTTGSSTYVSRKYVNDIKKKLLMDGDTIS